MQKLDFGSECFRSKDFFLLLKNKNLGAHFLSKLLFCIFNFKSGFLLKAGPIFEEVAKLGNAALDACNCGG